MRFLFCLLWFVSPAWAGKVYEVVAPPLVTPPSAEDTHISAKEIHEYQEIFLKDALPYSPSVTFVSNGPTGQQTGLYIRGATTSQNLVLVDDIYVNNPAAPGSGAEISQFLNADMETLEVLPGPQALAYGPGALGGVVIMKPKKGKGKPSLKVHGEGGSFKTRYGYLTTQGEHDRFQFASTLSGFGRGPAPFTNPLHGNRQADNYTNETVTGRLGYAVTDNWEVEGLVRYTEGRVQYNDTQQVGSFYVPVEAQNFTETDMVLSSLENRWGGESMEHSLKATYFKSNSQNITPFGQNTTTGAHPLGIYRMEAKLHPRHTLLGGLMGGQERATQATLYTRNHGGIYAIYLFKPWDSLTLEGGLRGDQYQHLGGRGTYNLRAAYDLTCTTRLRVGYGTNFKPPTLSDLFQTGPFAVPNPSLQPEIGKSVEVGIDQSLFHTCVGIHLTGFLNRIDQIALSRQVAGGGWQKYNGSRRDIQGLELSLPIKLLKTLEMKPMITLTRARDFPGDVTSPLIPTFKGALTLTWQATCDLSFFVQATGVNARIDSAPTRQKLSPYGLVNLGGSYSLTPRVAFFGRVENLGNKRYEEVYGYGMRGTGFFFGLEAKN